MAPFFTRCIPIHFILGALALQLFAVSDAVAAKPRPRKKVARLLRRSTYAPAIALEADSAAWKTAEPRKVVHPVRTDAQAVKMQSLVATDEGAGEDDGKDESETESSTGSTGGGSSKNASTNSSTDSGTAGLACPDGAAKCGMPGPPGPPGAVGPKADLTVTETADFLKENGIPLPWVMALLVLQTAVIAYSFYYFRGKLVRMHEAAVKAAHSMECADQAMAAALGVKHHATDSSDAEHAQGEEEGEKAAPAAEGEEAAPAA